MHFCKETFILTVSLCHSLYFFLFIKEKEGGFGGFDNFIQGTLYIFKAFSYISQFMTLSNSWSQAALNWQFWGHSSCKFISNFTQDKYFTLFIFIFKISMQCIMYHMAFLNNVFKCVSQISLLHLCPILTFCHSLVIPSPSILLKRSDPNSENQRPYVLYDM